MMDEVTEFLQCSSPQLSEDRLSFLASHLVTRSNHDNKLDMSRQKYESEISDLREMLRNTDENLKRTLEMNIDLHERNTILQRQQDRDSAQSNRGSPITTCNNDTSQGIDTEIKKLATEITQKEHNLKTLKDDQNHSNVQLINYKKKLGLAVTASEAQVEQRFREIKEQTVDLMNMKVAFRKENERNRQLENKLREESRMCDHLRIKLKHKELEKMQLRQEIKTKEKELAKVSLAHAKAPVRPTPIYLSHATDNQKCKLCCRSIQPIQFCDKCNSARFKRK